MDTVCRLERAAQQCSKRRRSLLGRPGRLRPLPAHRQAVNVGAWLPLELQRAGLGARPLPCEVSGAPGGEHSLAAGILLLHLLVAEVAAAVGPVGRGLDVFTQDGAGYDVVRGAPVIMEMKRRNSAREACYTYGGVHRIQCVLL